MTGTLFTIPPDFLSRGSVVGDESSGFLVPYMDENLIAIHERGGGMTPLRMGRAIVIFVSMLPELFAGGDLPRGEDSSDAKSE